MRQIEVVRYYTHGKERTLDAALLKQDKLQERWPDRQYTILVNARSSYQRYTVAQVKPTKIDILELDIDYTLPPQPKRGDYSSYEDFIQDYQDWERLSMKKRGEPEKALKGPLN